MAQGNAPRLRRRGSKRCISTDLLKIIGLLLTVQGTLGVALLQNGLLHMGDRTQLELWDQMCIRDRDRALMARSRRRAAERSGQDS